MMMHYFGVKELKFPGFKETLRELEREDEIWRGPKKTDPVKIDQNKTHSIMKRSEPFVK